MLRAAAPSLRRLTAPCVFSVSATFSVQTGRTMSAQRRGFVRVRGGRTMSARVCTACNWLIIMVVEAGLWPWPASPVVQ